MVEMSVEDIQYSASLCIELNSYSSVTVMEISIFGSLIILNETQKVKLAFGLWLWRDGLDINVRTPRGLLPIFLLVLRSDQIELLRLSNIWKR